MKDDSLGAKYTAVQIQIIYRFRTDQIFTQTFI